jgi:hypothetical protein
MNTLNDFFTKHGIKVVTILLILILFKSCGIGFSIDTLKKQSKSNTELIVKLPTKLDLKTEGLKIEKRMIQATDRKMLDVQRQNQIEKEIKELESIK